MSTQSQSAWQLNAHCANALAQIEKSYPCLRKNRYELSFAFEYNTGTTIPSERMLHITASSEPAVAPPDHVWAEGTIQNARSFKQVMGMRVSEWARQKQLCPALVYSVVSGQRKCLRGVSLQIAQELGMK